jgi:rhodanese-related sulfurtransferase
MATSVKEIAGSRQRGGAAGYAGAGARHDGQGRHARRRRARCAEVQQSGKVAGAVHVSRGMLEFRADPASPYHDKNFATDKTVLVYCASGGRSALAGKALKDLGYERVYNLGAFKDWAESGGAVDKPSEPEK